MKWITRKNIKVDRVACPWLIRRFVDPEAEFLFAACSANRRLRMHSSLRRPASIRVGAQDVGEGQTKTFVSLAQGAVAFRSRGASHFYFTYHTLTGRIFLRLSNGIVVRLTADKTPSPAAF